MDKKEETAKDKVTLKMYMSSVLMGAIATLVILLLYTRLWSMIIPMTVLIIGMTIMTGVVYKCMFRKQIIKG